VRRVERRSPAHGGLLGFYDALLCRLGMGRIRAQPSIVGRAWASDRCCPEKGRIVAKCIKKTDDDMKIDMRTFLKKRCPSNASRIALLAGLAVPFVAYGWSILKYAINIPYQDDFGAALNFTSQFIHAGTAEERVKLILGQHNEHRIVFCRLIFLGNYYVLHGINFRYCIILGNLGWVLTVVMLTLIFHRIFRLSLLQLLPIPFCLLSFTHSANMFWAIASLVNYWFILFSVAFLYCLSRFKFFGLYALFPVALFSSGGGVVLYLLGNLFLAARKRWKLAWTFFGLSTTCIFVYFYNYIKPSHHPKLSDAVLHPFRTIAYVFVYLGNIWPPQLGNLTVIALSSATGLTICVLSIYIIVRRRSDDFLRLTLGFVMLIAIAAASTRSAFGIGQALSPRYPMYPLLALTCIYVYASTSERLAAHSTVWVSIALCVVVYWGTTSAIYGKHFSDTRDNRIAVIEAFRNGDKDKLLKLHPNKEFAAKMLLNAERQRIYDYRHYEP
jgi:hypothetical protein